MNVFMRHVFFFFFFARSRRYFFSLYIITSDMLKRKNADILIRGIPFLSQLLEIWDKVQNLTDIISKQFSTE